MREPKRRDWRWIKEDPRIERSYVLVNAAVDEGDAGHCVIDCDGNGYAVVAPEDRALIGAAPRLLGALADIIGLVEGGFRYEDIAWQRAYAEARSAIAEATARSATGEEA
jgi:hypothetical protein